MHCHYHGCLECRNPGKILSCGILTWRLTECTLFQTEGILNPIKGLSRPNVMAYTFIACSAGMYIDCILLFRVFVVFPRSSTPRRMWFSIITPLVLLKLARFINIIVFMISFGIKSRSVKSSTQYQPLARSLVGETIEWSLQLVDNAYVV